MTIPLKQLFVVVFRVTVTFNVNNSIPPSFEEEEQQQKSAEEEVTVLKNF